MLLSQALRMRKFRPGISDVLYILEAGTGGIIGAIDISDIDNPEYISQRFVSDFPSDMAFDFTGDSYGPLFGGLYNYSAVVYVGIDVDVANDDAMAVFDLSNIGGGVLDSAVNNIYEDPTGLLQVRYFGLDISRQYLFGSYAASPDGIFALDTWGSSGGTEGMNVSQLLYASAIPYVSNSGRDITDVAYDANSQTLYVVADNDASLPNQEVIAVDCSTASSLTIDGYYGDADTNLVAGPPCVEVLNGANNPYSSTDWLYVGTRTDKILKINCSTPSSMSLSSSATLSMRPEYIYVPDETYNYIFACGSVGGDYVSSIANAKSSGSLSVADELLISGASTLTCIAATTPAQYGTRYLFVGDTAGKIHVISADGSGNLSLYATWDDTNISGVPSSLMGNIRRLQYQSLV